MIHCSHNAAVLTGCTIIKRWKRWQSEPYSTVHKHLQYLFFLTVTLLPVQDMKVTVVSDRVCLSILYTLMSSTFAAEVSTQHPRLAPVRHVYNCNVYAIFNLKSKRTFDWSMLRHSRSLYFQLGQRSHHAEDNTVLKVVLQVRVNRRSKIN